MNLNLNELVNDLLEKHEKQGELVKELAESTKIIALWPEAFDHGACICRSRINYKTKKYDAKLIDANGTEKEITSEQFVLLFNAEDPELFIKRENRNRGRAY